MSDQTCPRCGKEAEPAGTCAYMTDEGARFQNTPIFACTGNCTIVPTHGDGTPERLEFILGTKGKIVVEPSPAEFA